MGLRFRAVAAESLDAADAIEQAAQRAYRDDMPASLREDNDVLQALANDDHGVVVYRPCVHGYAVMNALWALADERDDVVNVSFHSVSMGDEDMHPLCRWAVAEIDAGRIGKLIPLTVEDGE